MQSTNSHIFGLKETELSSRWKAICTKSVHIKDASKGNIASQMIQESHFLNEWRHRPKSENLAFFYTVTTDNTLKQLFRQNNHQ